LAIVKQVLQSLRDGQTRVEDVPCPAVRPGHLLVRSTRTLISAGTERMLVEFGKASWIGKAMQQRDKVKLVWQKANTDGYMATLESVLNKLDQPLPLGYCNVGVVEQVGAGVTGFKVGDRVASNGKHAEVVCVPALLCARVPDGVADDEAAFTVLASIALQGIRLVQPTLGETVAVTGLGLIGLVTVQLLRANGCKVIGIDLDAAKCDAARAMGAEVVHAGSGQDPLAAADAMTAGRGVDAVIITAATDSDEPVRSAARMSRKRGRIVLVGVAGLNLSRADFYEKELSFQVSCSYGPGRYDPSYEDHGNDYPIGFVRWTEQRNFEAVLDAMAAGCLKVSGLISHRFPVDAAAEAYDCITGDEPKLGVLLEYSRSVTELLPVRTVQVGVIAPATQDAARIGFIGAGNYATAVLMPAFRDTGAQMVAVACSAGVSGVHAAKKFGIGRATTDTESVISDPNVDAVVITTRHDSHAALTCRALRAGKHVFVEKPLALTGEEIDEIESTLAKVRAAGKSPILMVGFNRRYAPHVVRMKALLAATTAPKSIVMTVNAGAIPASHWTQDPQVGGGRIVGEACHFIDLLRHLADSDIEHANIDRMQSPCGDTATISLRFKDGSIGAVHYFANGPKSLSKERLEVFASGRVLQLDNYRVLRGFGWRGFKAMRLWRQDKGQRACAAAFTAAIAGAGAPHGMGSKGSTASALIPPAQLFEVGRLCVTLDLQS
jgi:predicted dehydrogenase/threonine dehydrogenase-like Zn-dependent dehydrogenase